METKQLISSTGYFNHTLLNMIFSSPVNLGEKINHNGNMIEDREEYYVECDPPAYLYENLEENIL